MAIAYERRLANYQPLTTDYYYYDYYYYYYYYYYYDCDYNYDDDDGRQFKAV